jgi:hypothetical protein
MSQQPEALRLADWIESEAPPTNEASCADVAAELRRLHAVNMELLEALDKIAINTHDDTAERVARAALEQEPVAVFDEQQGSPVLLASAPMLSDGQPLYTRPPSREWVGLTDEEIEAARAMLQETLRAALEQPEQEPLYTRPPSREWIGLTDTENLPGEDSHCLAEDPDAMCAACNCWKKTREFCG